MKAFRPVTRPRLIGELTELILRLGLQHPTRVCLDGPHAAGLNDLASELQAELQGAGRSTGVVAADGFYRDASVRLEYGHTDVESFYSGWLDADALKREVLHSLSGDGPWSYLPSLRDPVSNRSTRSQRVTVENSAVVLIFGELLLGTGLPFDLTLHTSLSRPARKRRTGADRQWTLPAFDRYEADVDPSAVADVVLRYDDPAHPAVRVQLER